MRDLDEVMRSFDFSFFSRGGHKLELEQLFDGNSLMVDTRSAEEREVMPFQLSPALEVLHIPLNELPERFSTLPRDKKIAFFCPGGVRGALAMLYMRQKGYDKVYVYSGGYETLVEAFKPGMIRKWLKTK